ncbi:MAG: SufE family protein [Oscillochloris sp.]|nr:SufE family protein [Oscillochloris sp.]
MNQETAIPPKLQAIIDDFRDSDRDEKLELLLDFADRMPDLPEHLRGHQGMEQVHECMSPVFVVAEGNSGKVHFYFDVPAEAPTTRGYASLLAAGMNDLSVNAIVAVPNDFFLHMGLHQVLSPQRLNGISAILAYMKRQALKLA